MNHILQMLSKLLSVAKEAIDREGLIAILTISVGNDDEIEEPAQGKQFITNLSISYNLTSLKIGIIDLTSIAILVLRINQVTQY